MTVKAATKTNLGKSATSLEFIEPCLAVTGKPPTGSGWIHEVKYDGYRIQGHVIKSDAQESVRIYTRSGLDWTNEFAGIAVELLKLDVKSAILDGEIVAFDQSGVSSFSALQNSLKGSEKMRSRLCLIVFDILFLNGKDFRQKPLATRRDEVSNLVGKASSRSPIRLSTGIAEKGDRALHSACEQGLEGIVSKKLDASYRSGRSRNWIKSKCIRTAAFIVVGFVPNKSALETVGSLVVATHDGGSFRYSGRVGTGFSNEEAAAMWEGLGALATAAPPSLAGLTATNAAGVIWVEPILVVEVDYASLTPDGILRHARFKGFRQDLRPDDLK